jgi:hypothetical protein
MVDRIPIRIQRSNLHVRNPQAHFGSHQPIFTRLPNPASGKERAIRVSHGIFIAASARWRGIMLRIPLGTFVLTCAALATPFAQNHPDFSGTWVMDMSRSETAAQGADATPRTPVTLVIRQTARQLNIQTEADGRRDSIEYPFLETQPAREVTGTSGPSGAPPIQQAFAQWKDGRLETTANLDINNQAVTRTESHSLDASGREMTVETVLVVHHGYESNGGAPTSNRNALKDVYVRRQP